MRAYRYVGSSRIADRVASQPPGTRVSSADDVLNWIRQTGHRPAECVVTYVIDSAGELRIADRHSEHVACAGGGPVLSAGELTFAVTAGRVEVIAVSNQSTGYCPEPESWSAVARALNAVGLNVPAGFNPVCVFRRCPGCGTTNVVKDGGFECGACSSPLPVAYNCQS